MSSVIVFILSILEYVTSLEKEIREIKARNRELTESLAKTENKILEASHVIDRNKADGHIQLLVKELNDTIGINLSDISD